MNLMTAGASERVWLTSLRGWSHIFFIAELFSVTVVECKQAF